MANNDSETWYGRGLLHRADLGHDTLRGRNHKLGAGVGVRRELRSRSALHHVEISRNAS